MSVLVSWSLAEGRRADEIAAPTGVLLEAVEAGRGRGHVVVERTNGSWERERF